MGFPCVFLFFWYFPFILLDFPVNSDVFFTFVSFSLQFHVFPIFLVFVPFILLHSLSVPMFLCSVFVVFWLFSFILVFSRHFKRVPCLFLAVHMSHFYVFSIFWHLYSHFARSSSLLSTFFSMCFFHFSLLLVFAIFRLCWWCRCPERKSLF